MLRQCRDTISPTAQNRAAKQGCQKNVSAATKARTRAPCLPVLCKGFAMGGGRFRRPECGAPDRSSHTRSFTRSLTHPPTHPFTHSFMRSLTDRRPRTFRCHRGPTTPSAGIFAGWRTCAADCCVTNGKQAQRAILRCHVAASTTVGSIGGGQCDSAGSESALLNRLPWLLDEWLCCCSKVPMRCLPRVHLHSGCV